MWQNKMRRLEAHGDEFKLAPVFKINALRTLMIGKSKDYFDLWEADKDHTDPSRSYEELLAKVKDYVLAQEKVGQLSQGEDAAWR